MEDLEIMINLKRMGFKNVKKGAAHCLISPSGKEVLHSYSWGSYKEKCRVFLR
jgi:hypothetical protein